MTLTTNGIFYPSFTANTERYSGDDRKCIESVVSHLNEVQTSADKPGMLLGKIQSGKTKTFLACIALAFDNNFDVAIILTKGTKALARQTFERVRREFIDFHRQDRLQIFDIMTIPSTLTPYELNQKLIFVSKKQSDNLDRLIALFSKTYPALNKKRVLIVDDEADYASIGFRRSKQDGIVINTTTQKIDELRRTIEASAFLQVTATPYSLYLQPENLIINNVEFRPVRPAFTELVPINSSYIGGNYYFDQSQDNHTVASYIYHQISTQELQVLRSADRRRLKIEECLTSNAIASLRLAICNFIVGGCIRRIQDKRAGNEYKKFSFLVHTESQKAAHDWQESVVTALNNALLDAANSDQNLLSTLLSASYADLKNSIDAMGHYLPPLEQVLEEAFNGLRQGWLMISKVNSEQQVEELLDDEGQLRLRTPLNVFIGGQILDRGVTISNLIGFFYGRRPQVYQQDTVLQHSRMFGFRPAEDLTVTRFYTEPQIYAAMKRMHESDVALRDSIERSPNLPIVFIQRDRGGRVVPCSPNKILLSNTTTLREFKRILPVGFQTDYATRVKSVVNAIDKEIDILAPKGDISEPFKIPLSAGLKILTSIQPTLVMETDEGYDFDWKAAQAALIYLNNLSPERPDNDKIWCLVRRDRNISRRLNIGSHSVYADAPDTTRTEGAVARQVAIDAPMLILLRQNGSEDKGWRGTPFYWPVIVAQRNCKTAIFAHETMP